MTRAGFTPRAARELGEALDWIAEDNPAAAEALLEAALAAARRVSERPMLARVEPDLATPRFRFWSLRGFPYLLVIDADGVPAIVVRVVRQARDLPRLLDDLGDD